MIFWLDREFFFTFVSDSSYRLFGTLPEIFIDYGFFDIFHCNDNKSNEEIKELLEFGTQVESIKDTLLWTLPYKNGATKFNGPIFK